MLQIFIHKEGIARLATHKYESPSKKNIKIRNMHLTNYAVNKNCEGFVDDGSTDKVASGTHSWTLAPIPGYVCCLLNWYLLSWPSSMRGNCEVHISRAQRDF